MSFLFAKENTVLPFIDWCMLKTHTAGNGTDDTLLPVAIVMLNTSQLHSLAR